MKIIFTKKRKLRCKKCGAKVSGYDVVHKCKRRKKKK